VTRARSKAQTLDPSYFTPQIVKDLKTELVTEYNISGQLQQRPSPGDGGIIKKSLVQAVPGEELDARLSIRLQRLPKLELHHLLGRYRAQRHEDQERVQRPRRHSESSRIGTASAMRFLLSIWQQALRVAGDARDHVARQQRLHR
jgi:hypothetical protein